MTRYLLVVTSTLLVAVSAGCESDDEFENAPSARAPDKPLVTRKKKQGKSRTRGQVPPGHPPVGAGGGSGAGSGGAAAAPSGGNAASSVPVSWSAPSAWNEVRPETGMREAQYEIGGGANRSAATLAVFHFPSGGGSVEKNINRWIGQFESPEGENPKTETREVGELKVHTVDVAGTYSPGMGGEGPKENYRMLGAIAETDAGLVFFKMTGPAQTVGAHRDEFETLIESLELDS